MNNEYNKFEKFKNEFIEACEKSDMYDLEKLEKIKNFNILCNNFQKRLEKSKYKQGILEWFNNICKYNNENKKTGFIDKRLFNEITASIKDSLELDSKSIYQKFLDNEVVDIDSESDLEFWRFIDREFDAIMY